MYKNLNLKREAIIDSVKSYLNNHEPKLIYSIEEHFTKLSTSQNRLKFIVNSTTYYIDFYFNKKGTTTINFTHYKNEHKRFCEQIANHIINDKYCNIIDPKLQNKWLVYKNVDKEILNCIIQLISESVYYKNHTFEEKSKLEEYYNIEGSYGEKLAIKFYKTTNKVVIQGRPLLLFLESTLFFTEWLGTESIQETYNDHYNIEIDKNVVDDRFVEIMKYSNARHTEKLKNILKQSVYNLFVDGDMFEYSQLFFPALKALEGHLKLILNKYGLSVPKGQSFYMFDKIGNKYFLQNAHKLNINDLKVSNYIERAYNYYKIQRDSVFHWDDPSLPIDTTRVIETIDEVRGHILDTLKLIDEYYSI